MMSDFRGLYIHVPFCVRKCPYCDFYSTAGRGDLLENYAAAVVRNLREYPEQFDTVYFGGGTPNLIAEYMPGILQAVSTIPGAEISAECNPASASPETLRIMRRAGVNRISVGVQSLQDNELKKLGRLHNAKQAEELIVQARQAGFDVLVVSDGCRAVNVNPDDGEKAFAEMEAAGAAVLPLAKVEF